MGTCACAPHKEPGSEADCDSENNEGDIDLDYWGFDVSRLQRDTFNGSINRQRPRLRQVRDSLEHLGDGSLNSNNDEVLNRSVSIASSIDFESDTDFIERINLIVGDVGNVGSDSESSGAENVDDISHISFEQEINPTTHVYIDDDTCSICVSKFDDGEHVPEILPCGHTLCSFCIRKMSKRRKFLYVKCPLDRKVHKIKSRKLELDFETRSTRLEQSTMPDTKCIVKFNDGMSDLHMHDTTIGPNDVQDILDDSIIAHDGRERSDSLDNYVIIEDVSNEHDGGVLNMLNDVVIVEAIPNEQEGHASVNLDPPFIRLQNREDHNTLNDVNPNGCEIHDFINIDHSIIRPQHRRFTDNRRHAVALRASIEDSNSIITSYSDIQTSALSNPENNVRNISSERTGDSTVRSRRLPRHETQPSNAPRKEFTESDKETDIGSRPQRRRRHLPVTGNLDNVDHIHGAISDDAGILNQNETPLYPGVTLLHRGYHPFPIRNNSVVTEWHVYDGQNRHYSCDV